MVKWLPVIAAGLIFLSGCAPVVKENGKTMPRIDGEAKIEWNREKYPLAVEILNSHGEKERQVFYSPPKRVAAVWQNSIETLLALGVEDRIIAGMGVPDRKYIREEYQAGYEAIPYKSLENLDPETIMMMRPDFIAGWSSTFTDKVLRSTEFWNERGVHTYISQNSAPANRNRTIENEYADILNLGKIFDREEKAESLVKEMKDEISRTAGQATLTGKHPPRTHYRIYGIGYQCLRGGNPCRRYPQKNERRTACIRTAANQQGTNHRNGSGCHIRHPYRRGL